MTSNTPSDDRHYRRIPRQIDAAEVIVLVPYRKENVNGYFARDLRLFCTVRLTERKYFADEQKGNHHSLV